MRKYFDTVLIGNPTRPAPGALVYVYLAGTTTLATLYSDDGVTPLDNPAVADSDGLFEFYVANGTYDLQYYFAGSIRETLTDIQIYDAAQLNSYACSVKGSGSSSIPNNTPTILGWDTENFDYGAMHSTGFNTDLIIFSVAGLYDIKCTVEFASNATGYRKVELLMNGSTLLQEWVASIPGSSATVATISGAYLHEAGAGSTASIRVTQTSGGALNADLTKSNFSAALLKAI